MISASLDPPSIPSPLLHCPSSLPISLTLLTIRVQQAHIPKRDTSDCFRILVVFGWHTDSSTIT